MSIWKSQQGSASSEGGTVAPSDSVDSSAIDALRTELMGEINYLSAQLKTLPSYIAPHLFPYSFSVVPNETAWVHGIPPVKVDLPTLPPVTMYAPLGPYTAPSE